jgi:hypothetical protein
VFVDCVAKQSVVHEVKHRDNDYNDDDDDDSNNNNNHHHCYHYG